MNIDHADLRRLIVAIKGLGAAIRETIATARKTAEEAIAEKTKATNEAAEQAPANPFERVTVEIKIPSEETGRYYSEQKKAHRLQWWTFWATVATFIAVAAYAVITFMQWRAMKRTNSLTQQALESSVRPWIGIDDKATAVDAAYGVKPSALDPSKLSISIHVSLNNSGHSPASVHIATRLSRRTDVSPQDAAEKECPEAREQFSATVLPGAPWSYNSETSPANASSLDDRPTPKQRHIVGCAAYNYPGDGYGWHQTPFVIGISRLDGAPLRLDSPIPGNQLKVDFVLTVGTAN